MPNPISDPPPSAPCLSPFSSTSSIASSLASTFSRGVAGLRSSALGVAYRYAVNVQPARSRNAPLSQEESAAFAFLDFFAHILGLPPAARQTARLSFSNYLTYEPVRSILREELIENSLSAPSPALPVSPTPPPIQDEKEDADYGVKEDAAPSQIFIRPLRPRHPDEQGVWIPTNHPKIFIRETKSDS